MHLKRWLTGIIATPLLIYIIGPGPHWLLCLLLFVASLFGIKEFYTIVTPTLPRFILITSYSLTFFLFAVSYLRQILFAPAILVFWAFIPMTYFMLTYKSPNPQHLNDIGKSVLGPLYVALPLSLLLMINVYPDGNLWIFFLLIVIFSSDTGAFYFGKYFGKHKLYEAVSPGKTWVGAIGGLVSSQITALWYLRFLHLFKMDLHGIDLTMVALVVALAVAGQIGDLVESMIKRNHGVKDSGKILPGHGGILDRIDGLLFSIPVLYIYLVWP